MRRLMAIVFFLGLFILSLMGCGGNGGGDPSTPTPSNRPLGTPQLLALTSTDELDVRKILNLVAKLEVFHAGDENGIPVQEIEQPVQFVPKDPNNPRSPLVVQIIPDDGLHVSGIPAGDFLFRIGLFHRSASQGDIRLASIEEAVTIQNGQDTKVDFAGGVWRYDFDDDQDGYGNVTELMSGHFEKLQDLVGGTTKLWVSAPTNPKDPGSHPTQVSIIESSRIGSTSPDNDGHAKVIGDPLSVQSGVEVTIVHTAADGTVKETLQVFSRLDGSFETTLNNSIQGDKVQVYTTSLATMSDDPSYSSLSVSDPSFASVNLEIHFLPVKVNACFSINGRNAFPETGFVVVQAEGLGSNEGDSEVIFPTDGSGGVSAAEFYISSQTARLTELTVKIPDGAISGFPIIHNRTPNHESYGRCRKDNDVVVLQTKTSFGGTNSNKSDLFSDLLDAPFVALIGQPLSLNYHVLNQGVGDTFSAFQYRTYISPDHNQGLSDTDREVYPNLPEIDVLSDPSRAFETITGQILVWRAVLNSPTRFVLKKMDYVFNSVTFPL